jgi:hypothetical protein
MPCGFATLRQLSRWLAAVAPAVELPESTLGGRNRTNDLESHPIDAGASPTVGNDGALRPRYAAAQAAWLARH